MTKPRSKKAKYYIVLCAAVGAFFGTGMGILLFPGMEYNKSIGAFAGGIVNAIIAWYLFCVRSDIE